MKNQGENKMKYPDWLEDLFILLLSNYDLLWAETMPDEKSKHMKKMLWWEQLQNFNPDTILRSAKEIMIRCPTFPPRIGELVNLCDEFSKTNKYIEYQLINDQENNREKNQPNDEPKERVISLAAKKALNEIRSLLKYREPEVINE
jgi:hypothetical protein